MPSISLACIHARPRIRARAPGTSLQKRPATVQSAKTREDVLPGAYALCPVVTLSDREILENARRAAVRYAAGVNCPAGCGIQNWGYLCLAPRMAYGWRRLDLRRGVAAWCGGGWPGCRARRG